MKSELIKITLIAVALFLAVFTAGCTVSEDGSIAEMNALAEPSEDGGALFEPSDEEPAVADDGASGAVADDTEIDQDEDATPSPAKEHSLDDVRIVGDEEIYISAGKEFAVSYSASGGNNDAFGWELSGAPAWIVLEEHGRKRCSLSGTPPLSAGESIFTFTLTAIDSVDANNDSTKSITVRSAGMDIAPVEVKEYGAACKKPLKIELIENVNQDGDGDATLRKWISIGQRGRRLRFKATRGDTELPFGDVKWSFESKVDESYYCEAGERGKFAPNPMQDLAYLGKAMPIDRHAYYPLTIEGESIVYGEDCVGDDEGQWVRNDSWRPIIQAYWNPEGSVEGDVEARPPTFGLVGDFLFAEKPMPIVKFYNDGIEDMSRNPIEVLTVTVSDECDANNSAQIALEFELVYPDESIDRLSVEMDYENAKSYDKETYYSQDEFCPLDDNNPSRCEDFARSNLGLIFFMEDPKATLGNSYGLDLGKTMDQAIAYASFRLLDLDEKGDGSYEKKPTPLKKNVMISEINHIALRIDAPGKSVKKDCGFWEAVLTGGIACAANDEEQKYDEIDIRSIDLETTYWETSYFDSDEEDEWTWKKDKLHDYPQAFQISDSNEMDLHNSAGSIFHRKTWMPKTHVQIEPVEAEIVNE